MTKRSRAQIFHSKAVVLFLSKIAQPRCLAVVKTRKGAKMSEKLLTGTLSIKSPQSVCYDTIMAFCSIQSKEEGKDQESQS